MEVLIDPNELEPKNACVVLRMTQRKRAKLHRIAHDKYAATVQALLMAAVDQIIACNDDGKS